MKNENSNSNLSGIMFNIEWFARVLSDDTYLQSFVNFAKVCTTLFVINYN